MSEQTRDPEKILLRLEWTVIRRLDGLLHGDYRTLLRGFGLDLADLREYQYHDDVRYIDWNVTARLQTPYVREYNEDREVTAWFLLDLSPSVNFGSRTVKKASLATEFVTVLARLLTRHGNPVGALLYGDSVDTVIPARSGRRHVLHILHTMLSRPELPRSGATNLQDLLQNALRVMRRRSLVFVVSDFLSTPGWAEPLGQLLRRQAWRRQGHQHARQQADGTRPARRRGLAPEQQSAPDPAPEGRADERSQSSGHGAPE